MCKVFAVTGINKKNRGHVHKLMKGMAQEMVKFEKDGFGYAAMTEDGNIFGEKWLKPDHVFKKRKTRMTVPAKDQSYYKEKSHLSSLWDVIMHDPLILNKAEPVYETFGKINNSNITSVIMHSRHATTGTEVIENVHPFVVDDTAFIHNGIVQNHNKFEKKVSTCDSEAILSQYLEHGVNYTSESIDIALSDIQAYYACMVLSKTVDNEGTDVPILDIFKHSANLNVVYIYGLDIIVLTTEGQMVLNVCKENDWSSSRMFSLEDNVLIRFNAVTGELIEKREFKYEWNFTSYYKGDDYYKSKYGNKYVPSMYQDDYDPVWERTSDGVWIQKGESERPNQEKNITCAYGQEHPRYRHSTKTRSEEIEEAQEAALKELEEEERKKICNG